MGSQQLLVLPNDRRQYPHEGTVNDAALSKQDSRDFVRRSDSELEQAEKAYLKAIVNRLHSASRDEGPNKLQLYVLQAPIMLLSSSVVAFMAGLCSVVFAPLGRALSWGDDAKVTIYSSLLRTMIQADGDRLRSCSEWQASVVLWYSSRSRTCYMASLIREPTVSRGSTNSTASPRSLQRRKCEAALLITVRDRSLNDLALVLRLVMIVW